MGVIRFGVPEGLVLWARDAFGLSTFIETGTNRAATAVWASRHFARVITIEGQAELHAAAVRDYGHLTNVQFVRGDSRHLLAQALIDAGGPSLLWLDAHWCGSETFGQSAECPLIDELRAVNRRAGDVILIDDARLFVAPPPAPHRARDWPDLVQLGTALAGGPGRRYAAVFDDVVVAVPEAGREGLVTFIRAAKQAEPLWRRAVRRVLGMGGRT